MVHATRPEFISSIMREGVTATTLSHRVTGLWCHLQTPEAEKWSHDWGRTPLDVFSGCYIGVRTPEDSFDLKASKGTCSRISCKRSWPIELDAAPVGRRDDSIPVNHQLHKLAASADSHQLPASSWIGGRLQR